MIAAVVPAAGRGTRMGRPKLALPVDGRPMLIRVIDALRAGGATPVVVVTGPHDPGLGALARAAEAEACELTMPTPDMRSTVEYGLGWLEERYYPRPDDAFLLTPGDLPFLDAATVRTLCDVWAKRPAETILVATHAGRRMHPALIGWRHVAEIRSMRAGIGIDAYLRERSNETLQIAVSVAGAERDIDDLDAYKSLAGAPEP
jgi:molybdenum cofactor cytidylyltransferase